jgi:hypothetical protein
MAAARINGIVARYTIPAEPSTEPTIRRPLGCGFETGTTGSWRWTVRSRVIVPATSKTAKSPSFVSRIPS